MYKLLNTILLLLCLFVLPASLFAKPITAEDLSINDVKAFVYQWFAWFDHQADDSLFLAHIADKNLDMEFPEDTLRSHTDFVRWHNKIRATIASNTHEISELKAGPDEHGGFRIELTVFWEARDKQGELISLLAKQDWEISIAPDGRLVIEKYIVKKLP